MESELENLHRRLENVERSRRRGRTLAIAVCLLGGVLVFIGNIRASGSPVAVESSGFRLIDQLGKTRAELKLADGEPELVFYDFNATRRLVLTFADRSLTFISGTGQTLEPRTKEPVFELRDFKGTTRAEIGLGALGEAFQAFTDANGTNRMSLGFVSADRSGAVRAPHLTLADSRGRTRARLEVTDDAFFLGLGMKGESGTAVLGVGPRDSKPGLYLDNGRRLLTLEPKR